MPNRYSVVVPVAGHLWFEIVADDEDAAIEKALEKDWKLEDVQELNSYQHLVQGNVAYVDVLEADAELQEEDVDEDEDE